jgi:hypothetical protein
VFSFLGASLTRTHKTPSTTIFLTVVFVIGTTFYPLTLRIIVIKVSFFPSFGIFLKYLYFFSLNLFEYSSCASKCHYFQLLIDLFFYFITNYNQEQLFFFLFNFVNFSKLCCYFKFKIILWLNSQI